jgi:uncharacterized membrane protein
MPPGGGAVKILRRARTGNVAVVTQGRKIGVEHLGRRTTALVRVILCAVIGILIAIGFASFTPWEVSSLLAWDAAAAIFCAWVWVALRGADAATTQRIATREDDSRPAADAVLIAASIASLLGVGFALLQASNQTGTARTLTTAVAVATVALSWLAVQTVFVLRYAHLYYVEGGFDFHDDKAPDYADFTYVAFTIGMTYQVSDTDLTSKRIRKSALRHALLSYVFGIAVIAITINVVASLLRP